MYGMVLLGLTIKLRNNVGYLEIVICHNDKVRFCNIYIIERIR